MSTTFSELIYSRNLFFKGESLSNFTSSVRRPTHRRYSTTKIDKNGDTDIELVATKVSLLKWIVYFFKKFNLKRHQKAINFRCLFLVFLGFWAQKPINTWKSHRKMMSFWCLFKLNFEDKGAVKHIVFNIFSMSFQIFWIEFWR